MMQIKNIEHANGNLVTIRLEESNFKSCPDSSYFVTLKRGKGNSYPRGYYLVDFDIRCQERIVHLANALRTIMSITDYREIAIGDPKYDTVLHSSDQISTIALALLQCIHADTVKQQICVNWQ